MKTKELVSLCLNNQGAYIADWYDRESGTFSWMRFEFYTKKEIFARLRQNGVIVPRRFERKGSM